MEIFIIFVILAGIGLAAFGFQIWSILAKLKTEENLDIAGCGNKSYRECLHPSSFRPGISILKPLKGLDDNLFDNLESLCLQDYPEYEVIFSLQDNNDPAYKVARKIKDKYPEKDISVITERCTLGLNPKVNNLIPAYGIAKYEYILISDSNVMANSNYLKHTVKHMEEPDVGLVSNLIKGTRARSLGSIFENLHLNSFVMGSVCFLDKFLKMPCVVGKSMLMRKRDLENIGGLEGVKDVLAEDYVIGEKMNKMGKKVALSGHHIMNVNEYWGIRKFINRHTRWGKLRWQIGGAGYYSELLSNAVFMSFLPILLWEPSEITFAFATSVSLIKILGDIYIGRRLKTDMNFLFYLLSPVKDLLIGLIWFVPLLSKTVVWRGNRYKIGRDSMLSPCPETGFWAWRYRFVYAVKARLA
jgi:ceramide glucosyltransferase